MSQRRPNQSVDMSIDEVFRLNNSKNWFRVSNRYPMEIEETTTLRDREERDRIERMQKQTKLFLRQVQQAKRLEKNFPKNLVIDGQPVSIKNGDGTITVTSSKKRRPEEEGLTSFQRKKLKIAEDRKLQDKRIAEERKHPVYGPTQYNEKRNCMLVDYTEERYKYAVDHPDWSGSKQAIETFNKSCK